MNANRILSRSVGAPLAAPNKTKERHMRMLRLGGLLLAATMGLALTGCPKETPQDNGGGKMETNSGGKMSGTGGGKKVIAVIPKGTTHQFWKAVDAGAEQAGKEENVEIKWVGPATENDPTAQID